ncbi:MAG TPA: hypothetical protein VFV77_10120, partial [Gammaproteobacteria bacterium]|nr:hypothetical protein [Gammaproteobacteria bacterium]
RSGHLVNQAWTTDPKLAQLELAEAVQGIARLSAVVLVETPVRPLRDLACSNRRIWIPSSANSA